MVSRAGWGGGPQLRVPPRARPTSSKVVSDARPVPDPRSAPREVGRDRDRRPYPPGIGSHTRSRRPSAQGRTSGSSHPVSPGIDSEVVSDDSRPRFFSQGPSCIWSLRYWMRCIQTIGCCLPASAVGLCGPAQRGRIRGISQKCDISRNNDIRQNITNI